MCPIVRIIPLYHAVFLEYYVMSYQYENSLRVSVADLDFDFNLKNIVSHCL